MLLLVALSTRAVGQSSAALPPDAQAAFVRAQALANKGSGAAARLIVDSVIAATTADSPVYPEALYWRAQFAAGPSDAEQDYRRIIVDYPLSPRCGDALLALAQIELARGDRQAAAMHLGRFVAENPQDSSRVQAGLELSKLLLDDNQLVRGCAALLSTQSLAPAGAVELRNQLNFYAPRCQGVDTVVAQSTPTVAPKADSGRSVTGTKATASGASSKPASATHGLARGGLAPDTLSDSARHAAGDSLSHASDSLAKVKVPVRSSAPPTVAAGAQKSVSKPVAGPQQFTLQVAAYTRESDANDEVTKLRALGIDARVVGTEKPFRVRIGKFDTRSAADSAARVLKARQITTIVIDYKGDGH